MNDFDFAGKMGMRKVSMVVGIMTLMTAVQSGAQEDPVKPTRRLNPDGSIDVPGFVLPFSYYTSPEAREDMAAKFDRLAKLGAPAPTPSEPDNRSPIEIQRELTDRVLFQPFLDAQRKRYAVTMTEQKLGGVDVQVFTPKAGIEPENKNRVLINLHGGGFMMGWNSISQIESIPISAVGGIKVISVNYRMFPEARFPAASEDIAAVYRELLKTYKPSRIGIYGCSAGGILSSEAIAWFQKVGLPTPSAIGIWSAAINPQFIGDSAFITPRLGSYIAAPTSDKIESPYFTAAGAQLSDPMVAPSASKAVLGKFPPTLLATGTRASDMSSAARSQLDLLNAGAEARLLLWDGLDHCFMYNPEMPESREAYAMTVKFFDEIMDRAAHKPR